MKLSKDISLFVLDEKKILLKYKTSLFHLPSIPCKISSAHGKSRNISQGGKGICKKNPILNFKSRVSATWKPIKSHLKLSTNFSIKNIEWFILFCSEIPVEVSISIESSGTCMFNCFDGKGKRAGNFQEQRCLEFNSIVERVHDTKNIRRRSFFFTYIFFLHIVDLEGEGKRESHQNRKIYPPQKQTSSHAN